MSARALQRVLKLARAMADLAGQKRFKRMLLLPVML